MPNLPPPVNPLTIPPAVGGDATLSPMFKKPLFDEEDEVLIQNEMLKSPVRFNIELLPFGNDMYCGLEFKKYA
jgi:hypothetical protein